MADWDNLKRAVSAVIKENGNGEITGAALQQTLNSIITTVGENATFAGIATPTTNPGSPDGPVFYLASKPGIYSNFGGINVYNKALFIMNKNNEWQTFSVVNTFDFSGAASENAEDSNYIDKLTTDGIYIHNLSDTGAPQYILYVRTVRGVKTQIRTYYSDGNQFINSLRTLGENGEWSEWSRNEVKDRSNTFDFSGAVSENAEDPNYIDKLTTDGIYIHNLSYQGAPQYILYVRTVRGVKTQIRAYYSDGNQFINSVRTLGENGEWSEWSRNEVKDRSNTFDFSGAVSENAEDPNYIDKLTTDGIYIHNLSYQGAPQYILYVRTIRNVKTQIRTYYSDGNQFINSLRTLGENGEWSEWSRNEAEIKVFNDNNIDTLLTPGIYQGNSITLPTTMGILIVDYSQVAEYSRAQTLVFVNTNSTIAYKQRHYSNTNGWTDWAIIKSDINTVYKQFSSFAIGFDYSRYTIMDNTYIHIYDKRASVSSNYKTLIIPVSSITASLIFITMPRQGGAVIPISYWASSDILDSSNFIARDALTNFNITSSTAIQDRSVTGYPIVLSDIPEGTNYIAISWSKALQTNILISQYTGDISNNSDDTIFAKSRAFLGERTNLYGNNYIKYYKKGIAASYESKDTLIIIAGQSNARGPIAIDYAPQWLIDNNYKIDNYLIWDYTQNIFRPYELGVCTGAGPETGANTMFGFDIFFAKAWLEAHPNKKLYAVKMAIGGIPIGWQRAENETRQACWSPEVENIPAGETQMCAELVNRIIMASKYAASNNINLLPHCILWHQGEADMTDIRRPLFKTNLLSLLAWFRGLFGGACPIINGDIADGYERAYPKDNANIVFSEVNNTDSYFNTIDMSGKDTLDGVHFNTESAEYLGTKMYEVYTSYYN